MDVALGNIKVLDLTRTLSGPFCTMLLADMGADVVKVEEPSLGDETRSWTPFWNGVSTQFLAFNRNKRSITLNLKDRRAVEVALQLAKGADVLVESFRPDALNKLGLGYDVVNRENPGIIYCSISGFGTTGPMGSKPGYDLIVQGYGGLMDLTGEPDGPPVRVGYSMVDLFTGMMAYGAVLTALIAREQSGRGQYLEASLFESLVAAMSYHAVGFFATGNEPKRAGSGHPTIVPYQAFPTADGQFILGCANDGLWRRLCNALDCEELIADPRFKTNTDRVRNKDEIVKILSDLFSNRRTSEWLQIIGEAGIPCGPIQTIPQVLADAQVEARGMITSVPHPDITNLRMPACPMKLYGTPPTIRSHPPALGEHNDEILLELGFNSSEIATFRREGVI